MKVSNFRVNDLKELYEDALFRLLGPWWWKYYDVTKSPWLCTSRHGVTYGKTRIFAISDGRTWNIESIYTVITLKVFLHICDHMQVMNKRSIKAKYRNVEMQTATPTCVVQNKWAEGKEFFCSPLTKRPKVQGKRKIWKWCAVKWWSVVKCVYYEGHLESKERFAIQRYLLIIGKKQNMQVLSHTFTYFST